jgi:hypothetical protein
MTDGMTIPGIEARIERLLERLRGVGEPVGVFDGFPGRLTLAADAIDAEATARHVAATLGLAVSEGPVLSPQGVSGGMYSRRLAHVRVDMSVALSGDHPAALFLHEVGHCLDPGDYAFDLPWDRTLETIRGAVLAQLVACTSSHTFVAGMTGADPGPGQARVAKEMFRALESLPPGAPVDLSDLVARVAACVGIMAAAAVAPPWRETEGRQVAVDRGRGVMWLEVGPAAVSPVPPPSAVARYAADIARRTDALWRADPRFTAEFDLSRPSPTGEQKTDD